MRTLITVTEYPSMRGRYKIHSTARRDKNGIVRPADVAGDSAAAAQALEYALEYKSGYAIVAPDKVMQHIPEDMRGRYA